MATYFFEDLLGFKSGLFPCVPLLSRRRLSTSPVDLAIGFGPGLSAIKSLLVIGFDWALQNYHIGTNLYFQ